MKDRFLPELLKLYNYSGSPKYPSLFLTYTALVWVVTIARHIFSSKSNRLKVDWIASLQ